MADISNIVMDVRYALDAADRFRRAEENERAEKLYRDILEVDPSSIAARFSLAELLFDASKLKESVEELKIVRTYTPNTRKTVDDFATNAEIDHMLAKAYFDLEEYDQVILITERALGDPPTQSVNENQKSSYDGGSSPFLKKNMKLLRGSANLKRGHYREAFKDLADQHPLTVHNSRDALATVYMIQCIERLDLGDSDQIQSDYKIDGINSPWKTVYNKLIENVKNSKFADYLKEQSHSSVLLTTVNSS
jgi:tetratricopeptide (TPR) repeat protein